MKAIVYTEYGPPEVLRLAEVEQPTPKDGEVLIKVRAATVTAGDINMRGFTFVPPGFGPLPRLMFGWSKPRKQILGTELAGDVVAVGEGVTRFKPGDAVFGLDSAHVGAYAEYVCRPAEGPLALKPANVSYEEAAVVPFGAGTAFYFLRDKAQFQPGQTVLINGASGTVGMVAVQLAKHFGAEVTGVCGTRNVEMVASLGADHVIDYAQEDFTQNGQTYDVILDTVVGKNSFARCKNSLTPNGFYLAVAGGPREGLQSVWTSFASRKKVVFGSPQERKEEMILCGEMLEAGTLKSVVDRRFPLEETAEAHRYAESGRKRGCIVITVS